MIVCAKSPSTPAISSQKANARDASWHAGFLAMLPAIRRHARVALCDLGAEAREEAVQHVLCNACLAYRRLVELSKVDLAFPSVLARFGVAQVRSGRLFGGRLRRRDVMSVQWHRTGHLVERLDRFDTQQHAWQEILIEDRHAGPEATAISRLDFGAWLARLSPRNRRIAALLASGESTTAAARRLDVSAGRVSQLRRQLQRDWLMYHGELAAAAS